MNWIRRNWEIFGVFAVVALASYAMWLGRNDEPSSIRVELTAHAQKAEPVIGTPEFHEAFQAAESRRIKDYVEHHCVAVTSPAHDLDWDKINKEAADPHTLPFYQKRGKEHVAEQTSPLRCQ